MKSTPIKQICKVAERTGARRMSYELLSFFFIYAKKYGQYNFDIDFIEDKIIETEKKVLNEINTKKY